MFKKEAILNLLMVLLPILAIGLLAVWLVMSKQAEVDELQKGNKIIHEKSSRSAVN